MFHHTAALTYYSVMALGQAMLLAVGLLGVLGSERSIDELAARIERATSARTLGDLDALVADLPRIPADRRVAAARAAAEFRDNLRWYVAVNLLLLAIWALTGAGHPWFVWPLLGWGIGVAVQALALHPPAGRPRPVR